MFCPTGHVNSGAWGSNDNINPAVGAHAMTHRCQGNTAFLYLCLSPFVLLLSLPLFAGVFADISITVNEKGKRNENA